jgi:osmotically-inducible protein OsmY
VTDEEVELRVVRELLQDPKIDGREIAVSTDRGFVTLRGTVGNFRQKAEAEQAARRVAGVVNIDNELKVRILDEERRKDAELRGDVLQALMLDALIPRSIDATVRDGVVTLAGTADHHFQRQEAAFVAGNVAGVVDVRNQVVLSTSSPESGEISDNIEKAFERDAQLDARSISVERLDDVVILRGSVKSWAEHDAAVATAWASPGVRAVDDQLRVVL